MSSLEKQEQAKLHLSLKTFVLSCQPGWICGPRPLCNFYCVQVPQPRFSGHGFFEWPRMEGASERAHSRAAHDHTDDKGKVGVTNMCAIIDFGKAC